MLRGHTNSRRQVGQRVPLQLAAVADGEAPGPQPRLNTYSWSCTVLLSRPTLPGWEKLAPGSSALAPRAQKAQSRAHRKGVLSSCRDLMVTSTWEVGNTEDEGENTRTELRFFQDLTQRTPGNLGEEASMGKRRPGPRTALAPDCRVTLRSPGPHHSNGKAGP